MQIVHYTDGSVGAFDWELPPALAAKISQLPAEAQLAINQELEKNVHAFLLLLVGSLKMGPRVLDAFDLINTNQRKLTLILAEMARDELSKS